MIRLVKTKCEPVLLNSKHVPDQEMSDLIPPIPASSILTLSDPEPENVDIQFELFPIPGISVFNTTPLSVAWFLCFFLLSYKHINAFCFVLMWSQPFKFWLYPIPGPRTSNVGTLRVIWIEEQSVCTESKALPPLLYSGFDPPQCQGTLIPETIPHEYFSRVRLHLTRQQPLPGTTYIYCVFCILAPDRASCSIRNSLFG